MKFLLIKFLKFILFPFKGILSSISQEYSEKELFNTGLILSKQNNLIGVININPKDSNCLKTLEYAVNDLGFLGMKLHPRLDNFDLLDPQVVKLCNYAGTLKIPIIIDAFPDGTFLLTQRACSSAPHR